MKTPRNIKLVLAFDGTPYHGWQIQKNQNTVQGELREAIRKITGEPACPAGSGRTDAGTHARGFVASFATGSAIAVPNLVRALNSKLPPDIRILSAREMPAGFHARRSARSKVYRYRIYRGTVMPPHLAREFFHYPYPVDVGRMARAAAMFLGAHDFASFAAKGGGRENTVRHIYDCRLRSMGRRLELTVEGDGFLHHMIRNMAGTLLELGRGQMTMAAFQALFDRRDRTQAGFTAPARGLTLLRVRY